MLMMSLYTKNCCGYNTSSTSNNGCSIFQLDRCDRYSKVGGIEKDIQTDTHCFSLGVYCMFRCRSICVSMLWMSVCLQYYQYYECRQQIVYRFHDIISPKDIWGLPTHSARRPRLAAAFPYVVIIFCMLLLLLLLQLFLMIPSLNCQQLSCAAFSIFLIRKNRIQQQIVQ